MKPTAGRRSLIEPHNYGLLPEHDDGEDSPDFLAMPIMKVVDLDDELLVHRPWTLLDIITV